MEYPTISNDEHQRLLSVRQEAVIKAYIDALLPPCSLPPPVLSNNDTKSSLLSSSSSIISEVEQCQYNKYNNYRLSDDIDYIRTVSTTIQNKLSITDRYIFYLLLYLLDTSWGTKLLFYPATATAATTTAATGTYNSNRFVDYTENERSTILLPSLQYSSYTIQRKIFSSIKRLLCGIAYTYHQRSISNTGKEVVKYKNPFWEAMGYPGAPMDWNINTNNTYDDDSDTERVQKAMTEQLPIIQALHESQKQITKQIQQEQHHEKQQRKQKDVVLQFHCDIIIIGSGAGGCVAAYNLSKLGYHVILVEQGSYISPINIPQHEIHSMEHQYVQCGLLQNTKGTITILGGNALGGGTAINWSCCLSLPDYVLHNSKEWRNVLTTNVDEYKTAQQHILNKLGVHPTSNTTTTATTTSTTNLPHNKMNQKLQKGCNTLNYQWEQTGQNIRDLSDVTSGYVGMGDRYGNKNGGIQSFLIDAVQRGNTSLFEQCQVVRINSSYIKGRRRATGVECRVLCSYDGTYRKMIVNAQKAVIVSAGALYSPIVLRKSGLRNHHIGKHLRLHPVAAVMGFFPERIDSILGAPMTTVCNEFVTGPNNDGYGAKIECPCSYPGLLAAGSPWISGKMYKDRMLRYKNAVPLIVLQRDSGNGGSVRQSLVDGKSLVIDYDMTMNDNRSIVQSMQGAARILLAAGAKEVATSHIYDTGFVVSDTTNQDKSDDSESLLFDQYVNSIHDRGMKDHEINLFSAHQMGTCRMSVSCNDGVVDPNGETWECDDLYVMDSSVFPTASGSNPMVTVMTISHLLSSRLGAVLQKRDSPDSKSTHRSSDRRRKQQSSMRLSVLGWIRVAVLPIFFAATIRWYFKQ